MEEVWILLTTLELSKYSLSSLSRVKNVITGYILKGSKRYGYSGFDLTDDHGMRKFYSTHTLMVKMFIGVNNDPNKTVDHIDRNKENNSISNLRYATASEQMINRDLSEYKGRSVCQYDHKIF